MRTAVETDPRVMPDVSFRSTLPSTWTVPASLAPLGHDVSMSAPPGLLPSLLAPIEGYADAPELRWPSVLEPATTPDPFAAPPPAPRLTPPVIMHESPPPAVSRAGGPRGVPASRAVDDDPGVAIEPLVCPARKS